ncbi:MAG: hypothetical protein F6K48_00010 [Okeania sp. SIO3H1]|nr:hypothetical protein [Okeania sp. SIO3H1]
MLFVGDNPPLAPPPPRRGEKGRERGGRSKNCQSDFSAFASVKILTFFT